MHDFKVRSFSTSGLKEVAVSCLSLRSNLRRAPDVMTYSRNRWVEVDTLRASFHASASDNHFSLYYIIATQILSINLAKLSKSIYPKHTLRISKHRIRNISNIFLCRYFHSLPSEEENSLWTRTDLDDPNAKERNVRQRLGSLAIRDLITRIPSFQFLGVLFRAITMIFC